MNELLQQRVGRLREFEKVEVTTQTMVESLHEANKKNPSDIETPELIALAEMGLKFLFDVKEAPKGPWAAIFAMIIGAAQLIAGAVICAALSATGVGAGAAMFIGRFLINEGINDISMGVSGLISGNFSWNDYLKGKLESVGTTLAFAGLGKLAKGVKGVWDKAQVGKEIKGVKNAKKTLQNGQQARSGLNVQGMSKSGQVKQVAKYVEKKWGVLV